MLRTFAVVALAALAQIMMSSAAFAQDAVNQKTKDTVRLELVEKHITGIEQAMQQISLSGEKTPKSRETLNLINKKRAAAEDLANILTRYFLAKRFAPRDSASGEGFDSYVQEIRLLHNMIVLAAKCQSENKVGLCKRLTSLTTKLRQACEGEKVATDAADNATTDESEESEGADNLAGLDDMEKEVFERCNKHRLGEGLEPFKLDVKLCGGAREQSQYMLQNGLLTHELNFENRAARVGALAENVARQCCDAEMAMETWLKSPDHRRNIEDRSYSSVGVGRSEGYYTLMLGQ